ncbi:hypothetical protein DP923_15470 [Pontibacter arcticus]|uniref:Uncharacterized protein n=2 Tax=Pontibacter arcticus TaxID=2080288 RepID=A0A364RBE7_9BACT|nr:hypothetical protein DP923_15470 [Pontibacter arcticus]
MLMAAGLFTFASCDSPAENNTEEAAEQVEESAEQRADQIEEAGEQQADQMEENTDNMDSTTVIQ